MTPSWAVNRITRNQDKLERVMLAIKEDYPEEWKLLKQIDESMTAMVVMIRKEQNK